MNHFSDPVWIEMRQAGLLDLDPEPEYVVVEPHSVSPLLAAAFAIAHIVDEPLQHYEYKCRATPRWLSPTDRRRMADLYRTARNAGLTVDHIVPLRGRYVSGLHVPWNLRIVSKSENCRKSNSH